MVKSRIRSGLEVAETVAITAACGVLVFTLISGRPRSAPIAAQPTGPEPEDVRRHNWTIALNQSATIDGAGAKIALIEFSDFQCPFCGRHARETLPKIRAELIDKGKILYSFKHYPLSQIHPYAAEAARQAACAGKQSRFWDMHDSLFENQTKLSTDFFLTGPERLGLDPSAFSSCLAKVGEEVAKDEDEGRRFGVTATPTFFVGTLTSSGVVSVAYKLSGAYPYEAFVKAINELSVGRRAALLK